MTLSLTGKKTDRAPSVGRQPSLCAVYTKAIEYTQAIEYTPSIFAFSFPFFPSVACVLLQVEAGTKQGEERYALKRQATKERNKKRSTGPSRVVPHRSTTPARTCLTSLFGWEAVSQADMAALTMNQINRSPIPSRNHTSSSAFSAQLPSDCPMCDYVACPHGCETSHHMEP